MMKLVYTMFRWFSKNNILITIKIIIMHLPKYIVILYNEWMKFRTLSNHGNSLFYFMARYFNSILKKSTF